MGRPGERGTRSAGALPHLTARLLDPGPGPDRRRADARTAAAGGTSVGVRLTRALGLVVALLLLVGASGAGGLLVTGHSRARETDLRALEAANSALQLTLAQADASLRDYRLTGETRLLDRYDRAVADLPTLRERAEDLTTDPLQRSLLAEQNRLTSRWLTATDPTTHPLTSSDSTDAGSSGALVEDVRDANDRLDTLVRSQRQQASAAENRVRAAALAGTALTLTAALAVVVSTGVRTRRALVDPLRTLVDVLAALGAGDRRATADPGSGPSEVRSVALAVNDLAHQNALLLESAEAGARLHRLAGDIGRAVRDQLVAENAVATAVERLGEALRVDRVWVRMLEDTGLGPVVTEWARPPLPPLPAPARVTTAFEDSRSWVQELHSTGSVYAVPDTRVLRGHSGALDHFLRVSGARALLVVPIGAGDSPHGLLTVHVGDGPRDWTAPEVDLVRSVAVDLARALVLAGLYRAQERLLGELRDVEAVKSDLLATVSHELRTPLTSITGYLDLLRDGSAGRVPDDVAGVLSIIGRNTDRLTALIEDLLLLSRVESAPPTARSGGTTVADLVTGAAEAAAAAGPGTTLVCAPTPPELGGLRVRGDSEHLHRALRSVVDNAWKFSPAGAVVRLRVEKIDEEIRVLVSDNGMGIPADELVTVFGRFARGSNAVAQAVPGTGLGLTIARDLVRLHGGRISLDSVLGAGTTATVHLPLLPTEPPREATPHETTPHDTTRETTTGGTW